MSLVFTRYYIHEGSLAIVHRFGFFQFGTGRNPVLGTPTARPKPFSHAISRTLFHRPDSAGRDSLGGSITSHRRAKLAATRSSINAQATSTADSLLPSHRSNSTGATITIAEDSSLSLSEPGPAPHSKSPRRLPEKASCSIRLRS